jgi:hypothetical protein
MKINELIEADLGRRGLLRGVGAAAATAALPASVPAGVVKQVINDVKPSNVGAVSELLSKFDIRTIWRIFRTWDDPDMWQLRYLLSHNERAKLEKLFRSEHAGFLKTHPEGEWYQPGDDPNALPERDFGDPRRDLERYIDWRIASANADKLGMTQQDIERIYSSKHDDAMWEISKQWPKLMPTIDRLLGKKTQASQALDMIHKHGIKDVQKFSEEEGMWEVLQSIYMQSFGDAWPEGWPSFEEMLKKGDFSITPAGTAVPTTPGISAPHDSKQLGRLFTAALRVATGLLGKGQRNVDDLKLSPDVKLSLNVPTNDQGPKTKEPTALPAPGPTIDLGLGDLAREKDKVRR